MGRKRTRASVSNWMPVSSTRRAGLVFATCLAEVSAGSLLIDGFEQMFEALCARQRESAG
jgi:hypothetical protein